MSKAIIPFTIEDANLFVDMIENPHTPNEALMQAFKRHKEGLPCPTTGLPPLVQKSVVGNVPRDFIFV